MSTLFNINYFDHLLLLKYYIFQLEIRALKMWKLLTLQAKSY